MRISDVLATKGRQVSAMQMSDPVADVVNVLATKRIGAVVVEDRRQKLVGIFSERDLVRALAHYGAGVLDREVQDFMTTPVITCRSSDPVDVMLARMTMNRIRHLPVVDDGHLVGIVSIGDLVHHRFDEKELEASVLLDLSRIRA